MTTPAESTSTEGTPGTDSGTPAPEAPSTDTQTPPAGEQSGDQPKTYDEQTVKDLRKESANYRTRLRDTETALTTAQTELSQVREQIPALESRATTAEAQALKYRIALDAGLPRDLADRLVGADEDTLKADAESLKTLIGNAAPTLNLDQGTRTPPPTKTSVSEALRVLARG